MQPASQADTLIWRYVLKSSMNSEYIKPIKPPRHTVPYEMSSNYMLYSSLSLIFHSNSMKMFYTQTRQLFTQPQHLVQLLPRICKRLALVARLFGDGWDSQVSVISHVSLTAYAGGAQSNSVLVPAVQEQPTSCARFQACDWSRWCQGHWACWLPFWNWRCKLVLNGQWI